MGQGFILWGPIAALKPTQPSSSEPHSSITLALSYLQLGLEQAHSSQKLPGLTDTCGPLPT